MDKDKDFIAAINAIDKKIIKPGSNSRRASDGSVCCAVFKSIAGCNYEDSMHLSSTTSTITIGTGYELIDRVIEWCIQKMAVLEETEFTISSPTLSLKFHVVLESCFFKPYVFQMSDVEKLSLARAFKEQGVDLYKKNKVSYAFKKFGQALQYILILNINYSPIEEGTESEIDSEDINDLRIAVYNNLALCHMHYQNFASVIPLCTKSIMILPNVKAYYRRAVAFIAEVEYENAENDLLEALKLDKNNKAAKEKYKIVCDLQKDSKENYKKIVKNMFS